MRPPISVRRQTSCMCGTQSTTTGWIGSGLPPGRASVTSSFEPMASLPAALG